MTTPPPPSGGGRDACRALVLLLALALAPLSGARAEGSWQLGLFEGVSHAQPLTETNLGPTYFYAFVDIEAAGEVVNLHACGDANTDGLLAELIAPSGAAVADVDGLVLPQRAGASVDCGDDFTGNWDPAAPAAGLSAPFQFVAPSAGTYEIRLRNLSGNVLFRYDVTVTDTVTDTVDPRAAGGRLWSTVWSFNVGTYDLANSTDADLYVVADGGFAGTYSVWQLDLNNFAGYVYELKANDVGVTSTDPARNVSGLSAPKPSYTAPDGSAPGSGNELVEKYPMYLSYPARSYPLASDQIIAWDFRFLDSDGQDAAISPSTSGGLQDTGSFFFETNNTSSAIYEIVIDIDDGAGNGPDGVYGEGDVFLIDRVVDGGGTTQVTWNGRDNLSQPVAEGFYDARLRVRVGEFHFVADDVEVSGATQPPGIRINQAFANGSVVPTVVYWDDVSGLPEPSGDPDAFNVDGIYDGDHRWGTFGNGGGPGNNTFIDTYTYSRGSSPLYLSVGVIEDDEPRAGVVKSFSPESVTSGGAATMRLVLTNNDPDDPITSVSVSDDLPDGMVLAGNPAALAVTGAGCTGFATSGATTLGGGVFGVVGGTIPAGGSCTLEIDVTATLTDRYDNVASGAASDQAPEGPRSNLASLRVVPAPSGAPFACDGTAWASGGTGSTRLYRVERSSVPHALEELAGAGYAPTSGHTYDALGFNPVDGYLYAVVRDSSPGAPKSGSVLRIDAAGRIADLGRPVQGPQLATMPETTTRYVGGAFAEDGTFLVVTDADASAPANERSRLLAIDVAASPPEVVTNVGHGRDVGDIAVHPDGTLYATTAADRLVTLDPASGSSAVVGNGSVGGAAAGMRFDARGRLTLFDGGGTRHAVDLGSGATTAIAGGTALAAADGAACATGIALDKRAVRPSAHAGGSAGYAFTVHNASSTPLAFELADTLDAGRTFVPDSLVDPLGGGANAYGFSDTLRVTGLTLAPRSTATLSIETRVPLSTPLGDIANQASLEGLPAAFGGSVLSDDPATAGADGDPTRVAVIAGRAALGIAKRVTVAPSEPRVAIVELRLDNPGTVALDELSLPDDLDAVFGAGNHSIEVAPALIENPGTLALDGAFTGSGGASDLLVPSGSSLAPGATALIRFEVRVDTVGDRGAGRGVYANQVVGVARDPLGGTTLDRSDEGTRSDADGDGDPTESRAAGDDSDESDVTVFVVTDARAVSGRVFDDADVDGLFDVGERGLAGVTVVIRDVATGTCTSVRTDGDGRYVHYPVAPGDHTVHESAGTSVPLAVCPPPGRDPGGRRSVTPNAVAVSVDQADVADVDFADAREPTLQGGGTATTAAGASALHRHVFTAFADGTVDLSASAVASPAAPAWASALHRDADCDGRLDAGSLPITAPFAVDADERVCLLVRVSAPANAPSGARHVSTLTASYAFADPAALGHGLSSETRRVDETRAVVAARGRLVLEKVVANLSEGGAALLANAADGGDVLRYAVAFENAGGGPITDLRINDATPAFTRTAAPVACPATLPAALGTCSVEVPAGASNVAGYVGPIEWRFAGTLAAGARGTLTFDVEIE